MTGQTDARREERLAAAFVELADTLGGDFDVIQFLTALAEHAVALLDVAAAGVVLGAPQGSTALEAAATDPRVRRLEAAVDDPEPAPASEPGQDPEPGQGHGPGPALDCYRAGRAVPEIPLLHPYARCAWPRYVERARQLGFTSVAAVPMRLREEVVGALSLLRDRPAPLCRRDLRLAQALCDVATIGLLHQRAFDEQTVLSDQLHTALTSRVTIEQAKGFLAHRRGISTDDAFVLLRAYARQRRMRLTEVARRVVEGTADPALLGPGL